MSLQLTSVLICDDSQAFSEFRGALSAEPRMRLLAAGNCTEGFLVKVGQLRPDVVFVVLGTAPEDGLKVAEHLALENPAMPIICAAAESSSDLILRSVRAGAREFIHLPIEPEEFARVLDRTFQLCAGQKSSAGEKKGRSIAVFASKGGCGSSFIAANFAAATGRPTAIVDLNLQAGDLDTYLGVEPKYSIVDLVENRDRMDDALLSSYLVPLSSNLSFLPAPREIAAAEDIKPEHVHDVLQLLQQRFDYVVLDPPHTFDSVTLAALDHVDDIILVLALDIPAIRSTQRALALFDRLGYSRHKVHVVVNRWSKQIDLDLPEVERCLGARVEGFVQSEYRTVVNSINLGHPLVESGPSSIISIQIKGLAATILGSSPDQAESNARKSFLGGLFRRQPAAERLTFGATAFERAS